MSFPAEVFDPTEPRGLAIATVQIVSEETNFNGKSESRFTDDQGDLYVRNPAGKGLLATP